ncbi:MAG: protein kinase [Aridibacter famidurans]|nr:protein kinase [Aridibacter famidurans]
MEKERWQRLEQIFAEAADLPADDRERWLDDACAGDREMRAEIARMLRADAEADGLIDSPVFESPTYSELFPTIEDSVAPNLVGTRIGPYELVRELGRGGMGAVFLAKRADEEFEHFVAVKLIKRGMDTDFILKRFRNERQILAKLSHPHIARLLDGGSTADGLPYFVMEYVPGEPIHSFCDRRSFTVHERLQLFQKVCAAVNYAHEKLIIHRDLKPGNILVTDELDLRLLDFGIAKILDPEFAGDSLAHTATGMRLMTPEYASPEQIRGEPLTPASDVYALGVLLYELVVGRRPYNFPSRAPHDIARVICEEPALDPALAFESPTRDEPEPEEELARLRGATPDSLRKELSGELGQILLRCLRKSAGGRYGSATELSRDIASYLDGVPISVSEPDSGKFSHLENSIRAGVSLAVLPFQVLDGPSGNGASDTGEFLSLGLADAVITRLSKLKTIAVRPTSSILRYAKDSDTDPERAGRELNAAYILDGRIQILGEKVRVTAQLVKSRDNQTVWAGHFEEQSDDLLTLQDSISAQVSEALVETLAGDSLPSVEKRGTEDARAYEAYLKGRFHWHSYTVDGLAKALVYFYEAIALDPGFARAYSGVADYYNFLSIFGIMPPNESFPAAKQAALKAIELDPELAEAHISLGITAFGYEWDYELAEKHLKRAVALNPNLGDAHLWYAQLLSLTGRHEEAIREITKAERLNPQSPSVLVTCAFVYRNARNFEKSLEKLRQSLRIQPNYYVAEQAFSWVVKQIGNFDEAIRMCETATANTGRLSLPLYALGYSLAAAGRSEEAREVIAELHELSERQYVPPVYFALIHAGLGESQGALKWISRGIDEKDFWVVFVPYDARFDELRDEPGYKDLLRRIVPDRDESIHQSRIPTRLMEMSSATGPERAAEVSTGRKHRAALIVVVACIVLVFTAIGFWSGLITFEMRQGTSPDGNAEVAGADESGRKSLAILPFTTDSHVENEESLAVGLAESLYRRLGVASGLSVRPALINLADTRSATEIGKSFGASYVLRGTLERKTASFNVGAELLDASTGRIIWAETFDEPEADFPLLQGRIADRVLKALTVELSASERDRLNRKLTDDTEAYQLYLAGRFLMRDRSADNLEKAIASFEKARERDPEFALAYVGLADAYSLLNLYRVPPPKDAYAKAKENAEKALSLDESLAEAHASLAYVLFYGDWNRTDAVKHFTRAIELNPSYSTAHHWFALALAAMDRPEQAIEQIDMALELEPQSPIVPSAAGLVYYYARRYEDGLRMCRRSLQLNAVMVPAHKTMRVIYEATGNASAASEALLKERTYLGNTDESEPGWAMITAQVKAVAGDRKAAGDLIARALSAKYVTDNPRGYAYEIAVAYSLVGEKEKAIDWLERARSAKDHSFNFVLVDPRLDGLRGMERFRKVIAGAFA